ncbi:Abscisic acid receptor PYL9 [Linum perenne]
MVKLGLEVLDMSMLGLDYLQPPALRGWSSLTTKNTSSESRSSMVITGFNLQLHFFLCKFLQNYSSVITVHPEVIDGRLGTLVIESFVVDVPQGNTKEDTCYFVRALINCNLRSLTEISERMAVPPPGMN